MPPRKLHPYSCPRCGYETSRKDNFHKHLYLTKKQCPTIIANIELTDDIKEHLIQFRVYHPPKTSKHKNITNQVINQYNTVNNFVNNMQPLSKITKLTEHQKRNTMPFELTVDLMYENMRSQLEQNKGNHSITFDDVINTVDSVTKVSSKDDVSNYNLLYDNKTNKILLHNESKWHELHQSPALKLIINKIQEYFWNAYECYLIRKIQCKDIHFAIKAKTRDLLQEYYSFLASIGVDPFVHEKHDNMIIYTADKDEYWMEDKFDLVDEYNKLFKSVLNDLTSKQKDKWISQLLDIIKRNTKNNVHELNKLVMNIINMDDDFKQSIALN